MPKRIEASESLLRSAVASVAFAFPVTLLAQAPAPAAPAAQGTAPAAQGIPQSSPFDQDDPEIARIKSLDWKDANFDALTPTQQAEALMALNKALSLIGTKASTRADLLVDYLDEKNLGPAYASAKTSIPDPKPVSYDQMRRLAAAYVLSPAGSAKVSGEFSGNSEGMIAQYITLYDKSARRLFEEAAEARYQVRSMGLFLQEQGKLEDFKVWAPQEEKRRDDELAQQQAQQQAAAEKAREERAQVYNEQRQQQQELAAKQMELALQQQQLQQAANASSASSDSSQQPYDNENWLGYGYPYGGAYWNYYNTNIYRGYVKDKYQDAWNRWHNNHPRPVQPMPRPVYRGGGGGGFRGGGRR